MNLNITRVYNKQFRENLYSLSTDMLKMKSTHLFIASNAWESVYIELDDSIPEGYLRNLHTVCDNITVNLPDVVTDKTLGLLIELYPDKSGALRRAYMQGTKIEEVLEKCLVQ